MIYLGSTFSLQMIPRENCSVVVEWITPEEANQILGGDDFVCTVGHASTAIVLSDMLGRHIEMNRIRSSLGYDDILVVGQLVSGRLPEGCTTLPDDAVFTFVKVTLQRKEEA